MAPVASVSVTEKPRVSRARTSLRSTAPRVTKAASAKGSDVHVGDQRIYHVTHVSNLAGILAEGKIVADATPVVDISAPETRKTRRAVILADASIANHVPFFLAPNASIWQSICTGESDSRLSPESRGIPASEFVILVSTVKNAREGKTVDDDARQADIAVTDGDAADAHTRYGATRVDSERLLRKLRSDAESDAILDAEFLVRGEFPFELITLIGVGSDKMRDEVKAQIAGIEGHRPKVAVYPPWFLPSED